MGELIHRKFQNPGDVERVRKSFSMWFSYSRPDTLRQAKDFVVRSSALQRTRALAQAYAEKANQVLEDLPESEAKTALEVLTERIIGRKK